MGRAGIVLRPWDQQSEPAHYPRPQRAAVSVNHAGRRAAGSSSQQPAAARAYAHPYARFSRRSGVCTLAQSSASPPDAPDGGIEPPSEDAFFPTAAPSSRPISPAHAPRALASAGRSRASAPVARSTRPVQLPSASSSPSSSPSTCSIRSSDDAMSLTLKSRATTSARSITGSSMVEGSVSGASVASGASGRVFVGGQSNQLGKRNDPDG